MNSPISLGSFRHAAMILPTESRPSFTAFLNSDLTKSNPPKYSSPMTYASPCAPFVQSSTPYMLSGSASQKSEHDMNII